MATDLERLIVGLSADFKSYENAMAKASGVTRKQLAQIKADAAAAGGGAVVAFDGAARGAQRFGASAARATGQVRSMAGETGNLAAQINDIGVQLAGGQSPFLIALQQGSQINQVLGGQGARGAVAALAGAFTSLLNPVSIATIAIIGLGAAAVQYFSSLLSDGESSEETLKAQADLIKRVADEWGEAVPAVREYAEAIAEAKNQAELLEAVGAIEGNLRSEQVSGFRDLTDAFPEFAILPQIQADLSALESKIKDGSATSADYAAVSEKLADLLVTRGSPALAAFATAFDQVAAAASRSSAQIAEAQSQAAAAASVFQQIRAAEAASIANYNAATKATAEFVAEQERLNGLTEDGLRLENEAKRLREDAARAGGILTDQASRDLAARNVAADAARAAAARAVVPSSGGGGGGSSRVAEIDREREAVTKLIEALQFEQSLVGLSNVEKEKANALRRAGAAATPEERAQIESLVVATYEQAAAIEASEAAMQDLKDLSRDVLGGMVDDLIAGKDAADILANALTRVGASLAQTGVDSLIEAAFGGGFGGLFGGGATRGLGVSAGGIGAGVYHQGGVVGDGSAPTRVVSPAVFRGAKRMHTGGVAGLMAGEVPAILQRGERVIPRGGSAGSGRIRIDLGPGLVGSILDQAGVEADMRIAQAAPRIVGESVQRTGQAMSKTARFGRPG